MELFLCFVVGGFLLPLIVVLGYAIVMWSQFYKIDMVLSSIKKTCERNRGKCGSPADNDKDIDDASKNIVDIALKRINGWEILMILYSAIGSLLNLWSVVYCLLNLYAIHFIDIENEKNFVAAIMTCSLAAAMSTMVNLILNGKKRGLLYRKAWQSSSKIANEFFLNISKANDMTEINQSIHKFQSEIVTIENTLPDED